MTPSPTSASHPAGSTPHADPAVRPPREVPVRTPEDGPPAQLYETLVNAINEVDDGVVVMDGERFQFVNHAFVEMVGYEAAEMLSPSFSVRGLFDGEPTEGRYEAVLRAKDGRRTFVEVAVKPIQGPGRALRFAIIRDVTERKRDEAERERARKDMAQTEKLAALGSLVNGVAHEIRTPLAFIQNNASILSARLSRIAPACSPEDAALVQAALSEIGAGVDRIHRLVRDLHRFSKLPDGELVPTNVAEIVDDAIRFWVATHPAANVDLEARHAPQPPARVDRAKIQQVILNLLQNAAEAMPGGGRVTVETAPAPDGCRIVVRDEGVGISHEVRGLMFEPLFTTKPDAMGLGLSIARRIVELHRGRIECARDAGPGTAFVITLPR